MNRGPWRVTRGALTRYAPRVAPLEDIRRFLAQEFPQNRVMVDEAGPMRARVRHAVGENELRPGRTVSGPTLMATADAGAFAALLATIGIVAQAVTTNLNISFFRRPSPDRDIVADAKLLKVGKRLVFADVTLFSDGDDKPVAHASVTYALP